MANNSETNSCAGITIGFAIGLLVVFGLERVVEYLENLPPNAFELLATVDRDEVLSSVHQGTAGLHWLSFALLTIRAGCRVASLACYLPAQVVHLPCR
jgi:hypothetical protein